jgi:hypothetical protein
MFGERDQHAGRAEAALQAMMLVKALLQSTERPIRRGKSLDRGDGLAVRLYGEHQARAGAEPVDQHRTGTAHTVFASHMRAGQIDLVAKKVRQQQPRLDLTLNGLPADVKLNVREFPVLGTVSLRNGDTGELL